MDPSAWTDGLPSNLLAEFVGLMTGITATYLVLDRLIERNRRRHFKPLLALLERAVGQHLAALAHLWAFVLGKANGEDLAAALEQEVPEAVRGLQARIEADLRALEASPELRLQFISLARTEPVEIARETCEDIAGINDVADRVSPAILEDIQLERMLAELAADARALDHVRSFAEYLSNVDQSQDAPMDLLLSLSLRCYRRTQDVWKYMQDAKAAAAAGGKP